MGSISGIIESLDTSEKQMEDAKEALEALEALAQTKADFFRMDIEKALITAGSDQDRRVPIEAVLDSTSQTHAMMSNQVNDIGAPIGKALTSFCRGSAPDIIDGVAGLVTDVLKEFLGESEAAEDTLDRYVVLTEEYSIIRLDLRAWQRAIESSGIRHRADKVSAFVLVKSAVDLEKIGFNTFLYLYRAQLHEMQMSTKDIEQALDRATLIYEKFHHEVGAVRNGRSPGLTPSRSAG
ncbi:hypothetical protein GCM10027160_24460 [Streptomyces calidiresistens]|uniref:Uncharacterized protein n=1 Tax=Streptomyces calidiresistens TaxID=1485586 RepID=A0A7W3T2W8_9ACTN|nr:hypothetical protein [Streptomyces calidiresistens]MBB0229601.1 hypothetical protein [Streptomyces calidiresistens]